MGGTDLNNDNLMNTAWTISTLLHVLMLSIACVQAKKPKLIPESCTHLQPAPCIYVHSQGPQGYDLQYFYEKCYKHQCRIIQGSAAPPPPYAFFGVPGAAQVSTGPTKGEYGWPSGQVTFPYVEQPFYDHYSRVRFTRPLKRGNVSLAKFLDPSLFRVDQDGRFLRRTDFWFCSEEVVDYTARVEDNTGIVPGQKEDMYVHCEWLRMESFLGLTNCELETRPCEECLRAYRYYLCAMYFPRCEIHPDSETARGYRPENSTGLIFTRGNQDIAGADYMIIKPCRTLCWDVVRTCTLNANIDVQDSTFSSVIVYPAYV